jgi:hypothetical protein
MEFHARAQEILVAPNRRNAGGFERFAVFDFRICSSSVYLHIILDTEVW